MTSVSIMTRFGVFLFACLLTGCASLSFQKDTPRLAYIPTGSNDFARYMPIIVIEKPQHEYNRIGKPVLASEDGKIRLHIDSDTPVAYTEQRQFETTRGRYTNLIYRIHFEKVPFSLFPFNLTTGRNVGLLVIVTLDEQKRPLLITTVHTCGCYLAFVPTSNLPDTALPDDWNHESQQVYGATLPGRLPLANDADDRVIIYLSAATHRVINLASAPVAELRTQLKMRSLTLEPVATLDALPLTDDDQSVSMFEPAGSRKGYVRDAHKPFEFLLMSWWALDVRVGVDKRYGRTEQDGRVFYTSLKPWARAASDMRDFPRFLEYWGWRL